MALFKITKLISGYNSLKIQVLGFWNPIKIKNICSSIHDILVKVKILHCQFASSFLVEVKGYEDEEMSSFFHLFSHDVLAPVYIFVSKFRNIKFVIEGFLNMFILQWYYNFS